MGSEQALTHFLLLHMRPVPHCPERFHGPPHVSPRPRAQTRQPQPHTPGCRPHGRHLHSLGLFSRHWMCRSLVQGAQRRAEVTARQTATSTQAERTRMVAGPGFDPAESDWAVAIVVCFGVQMAAFLCGQAEVSRPTQTVIKRNLAVKMSSG